MATKIRDAIVELVGHDLLVDIDSDLLDVIKTANTKGWRFDKLEKDFWLTICLQYLAKVCPELSFKWWTCLNKVYRPYFRLSEDLDFSQTIEDYPSDSARKQYARGMREKVKHIASIMWRNLNDDEQHHKKARGNPHIADMKYTYLKYILKYPSLLDRSEQEIKIEVTYTHRRHLPQVQMPLQSLYQDLVYERPLFPEQSISCMHLDEMMAEKVRAALTREYPAIRDFFDIWWMRRDGYDFEVISDLVREKVAESGNRMTVGDAYDTLQEQIETELGPVLLWVDEFSFDETFAFVSEFVVKCQSETWTA